MVQKSVSPPEQFYRAGKSALIDRLRRASFTDRENMAALDAEKRPKLPIGKIDDVRALGAAIRQKRESIGMRQAELAALSGVGVRFLSELENGKESVHVGRALRVLRRLGLDLWLRPRSDASRAELER